MTKMLKEEDIRQINSSWCFRNGYANAFVRMIAEGDKITESDRQHAQEFLAATEGTFPKEA